MKPDKKNRRIYLGMPGYGKQTSKAGMSFWRACADMSQVKNDYRASSLLANNFNQLWCGALNAVHGGEQLDYFAMLHDDIGCGEGWLDVLIDELEAKNLDVLGVAVPIKDHRGITSLALANGQLDRERCMWTDGKDDGQTFNHFRQACRLSMHDIYKLPPTFTSDDIGYPLLLNTGCWVCKFDMSWATKVHFEINDRIVFDTNLNRYRAETEPEDWHFSRLLHELGLKIGATRKIAVLHQGEEEYHNIKPWGSEEFDSEMIQESPVEKHRRKSKSCQQVACCS